MTASIRTLAVLGTFLVLEGCATNRADSLRMLDNRADYSSSTDPLGQLGIKEGGLDQFRNSPVPVRTRPQVAAIWIHRHETPSKDYFWGGWISVVIEQDQWVLTKPGALPAAPGITTSPGQVPRVRAPRLMKTKAPATTAIPSKAIQ